MKKVVQLLILLFVFYYLIQFIFHFFDKGYEISYTKNVDDKEINIKEVYSSNEKNERDNYYLELTVDNTTFNFKIYNNLMKLRNIIKDVKYIKTDTYTCILPIFKNNQILTDILCKNSKMTTYYHNIKGENPKIDEFANNIELYNVNNWIDNSTKTTKLDNVSVYEENIINKLYLGLTSYNGLYNINNTESNKIVAMSIFDNDIYNPKISAQINGYYLVADYNEKYEFNKFYLIDFTKNIYDEISSKNKISLNSYIQGTVDNSVYLIDIDNRKQYEINIKNKSVNEIGNEDIGIKFYNNGVWEDKNIFEIIQNEEKFIYQNIDSTNFDKEYYKIDKIGGEKSGYYYLYEKNSNVYNVYKSYIENPNNPIFLFSTSNIDRIKYVDDYIIFIDNNFVKIYNDNIGMRNIIKYDELAFNKNLNIYAYYD